MGKKHTSNEVVDPNRAKLIQAIDQFLDAKGLNRKDLPNKAGVSQRTLDKLFEEPTFKGIRSDAILRMASALGCSIEQCKTWLNWAGHETFSIETIRSFFRNREAESQNESESTLSPAEYFAGLTKDLQSNWQALMCVCVTSKPAPIDDDEMKTKVVEALQAGLHIALVCPYPCGGAIAQHYESKPNLIPFYDQVFTWTRALAGQLRMPLSADQKRQVQIFIPVGDSVNRPFLVPPVVRQGAPRPCLVKLVNNQSGDEKYQLGSYVRREKQWQIFYPPSIETDELDQREASEICNYWKDYFGDLLTAWDPKASGVPFKPGVKDWAPINPDGSQQN